MDTVFLDLAWSQRRAGARRSRTKRKTRRGGASGGADWLGVGHGHGVAETVGAEALLWWLGVTVALLGEDRGEGGLARRGRRNLVWGGSRWRATAPDEAWLVPRHGEEAGGRVEAEA